MEKDILFEIKELHHLIYKGMMKSDMPMKCKPTATQIRFIDYLVKHHNEDVYQSDLEKEFNITRATVHDVITTMEKNGMITREKSNIDTRRNKIILNEDIFSFHKKLIKEMNNMNQKIVENVNLEELETFMKVLEQMKKNMHKVIEGCDNNG